MVETPETPGPAPGLTAPPGGIEVHPEDSPGDGPARAVVRVWGELDEALRPAASQALMALLGHDGPVVVDLAELTFIDSSGLAFLMQLRRFCDDSGHRLAVLDPPDLLLDLLDLIGARETVDLEFRSN